MSPMPTNTTLNTTITNLQQPRFQQALVLGSGAFATSIASVLATRFDQVWMKVRSQSVFEDLTQQRNNQYLPGIKLPPNIKPFLEWQDFFNEENPQIQLIVSGLPTDALKSFHAENQEVIRSLLKTNIPFVCLAKGISIPSLQLTDHFYGQQYAEFIEQFTFLSGPSFAHEIVAQQATCVSLAGHSRETLQQVILMMTTAYFKLFPTLDVKGVLLGGALKNVLAIAGGIAEGMGFNDNTRAAIITRGIEEMLRYGQAMGARPETFYGPSGMGDLILTMTGQSSRNKAFGLQVGKGAKPSLLIHQQKFVVEGYKTAQAAHELALQLNIHVRLFPGIYRILYENCGPDQVLKELMMAPVKFQDEYWNIVLSSEATPL